MEKLFLVGSTAQRLREAHLEDLRHRDSHSLPSVSFTSTSGRYQNLDESGEGAARVDVVSSSSGTSATSGDVLRKPDGSVGDFPATFTVDQAVDKIGFGKFQLKLSCLAGFAWMADAMEMMILSILSPALKCEWDLNGWQQALVTTVVFCGMMLSSAVWGKISDHYGRRVELLLCSFITFFYGLISAFAPNFLWLLFLRCFVGIGIGGAPQSVTLYSEFLPSKQRAKCLVLTEVFWALGSCFEVVLALFIMPTLGWRWLLGLSSIPLIIFDIACLWMPESARFYMASGQTDKAYAVLARIAKENGVSLPTGELVTDAGKSKDTAPRGRFLDLVGPDFRKTTLLLWIIWLGNAFSYYGVVLMTTELLGAGDTCHVGTANALPQAPCPLECRMLTTADYSDLLWTTVAEFPALFLTAFIIDLLGRKRTMALEFVVYAIFVFLLCICTSRSAGRRLYGNRFSVCLVVEFILIIMTLFLFVARGFISGAFQTAYVYTPEVYPTSMRSIGLGVCSAMARIGAILTPFNSQVVLNYSVYGAISIYGCVALAAAVASLLLPIETKGREMKDTRTAH